MLRQRENPESFKAGVLSVTVHVLLLGALLISFNWKTTHPVSITEVELWDSIPSPEQKTLPPPDVKPEPVVKESPKPEPIVEPEPEPKPQVDIVLKKKPIEKPVKKETPKPVKKSDEALAKLKEELRRDALKQDVSKNVAKSSDALKKLQQDSLSEDKAEGDQKNIAAKAAANKAVVDSFIGKIQAQIRSHVNKSFCGDGNPELKFEIDLLPTGELGGTPKLTQKSGMPACDDAVERAIRESRLPPPPSDSSRRLNLTFRPNEN